MATCVRSFLIRSPPLARTSSSRMFSTSYDLKGTLKNIGDLMKFDSGFVKREAIVLTEEAYPQEVKVEFLGDNSNVLEKFDEGDQVTVSFNIRGREWEGKHFVNLTGWRIQLAAKANKQQREEASPVEAMKGELPF